MSVPNKLKYVKLICVPAIVMVVAVMIAVMTSGQLNAQMYSQGGYQQNGYQQNGGVVQGYQPQGNPANHSYSNHANSNTAYSNGSQPVSANASATLTSAYWTQNFKFGSRHHDFGAVPKGSKQEVVFEFENNQDFEVQLLGVRASCGCTRPTVLTELVKPGETARVLAVFDTLFKPGPKSATVTVSLRKNNSNQESGEVQFSIAGEIRKDVVLNPGKIEFENVALETPAERTVTVMYAGDPRWRILDVKSTNPNLSVESRETKRDAASGRVDYELVVKLNGSQSIGVFSDQLTLITNDARTDSMNVNVEGHVKSLLQSSPVTLGSIDKGEKVSRKLVLRGAEAFEIKEVRAGDSKITFTDTSSGKTSTLHVLTYELDTSAPGMINCDITVVSSIEGQPEVKIPFSANIVQRTATN